MFRVFFLLALFVSTAWTDEAQLSKARQNLEEATKLIKENPHNNLKQILSLLSESKDIMVKESKLSKSDEDILSKVCSHMYWLSKFSTTRDLDPAVKTSAENPFKKPVKNTDSDPAEVVIRVADLEWQKLKAEKEKAFQEELLKTQAMEEKLKNDPMSNMLNYIELQVKVIDLEKALEIKSKTEEYNAEIIKERKEILDKAKAKIKDFNTLITNKNYDDILLEVVRLLKSKELEPKEYSVVRMFAMEMKAMITIKDRLIAQGENCALPLASILGGLTGVVISINEKGISVLSDEHERSFLYWNTLSEQTLISLSLRLLDDKVEEDLYILGLANLRQENYEAAYRYFKKLTNIGPDDYLRYRDYLSLCETGYRLKYASKFEEIFGQIDKVSKQGNRQSAIDLLMQFKDDYLNTDLGSSYMERFKLVYNEIIRR